MMVRLAACIRAWGVDMAGRNFKLGNASGGVPYPNAGDRRRVESWRHEQVHRNTIHAEEPRRFLPTNMLFTFVSFVPILKPTLESRCAENQMCFETASGERMRIGLAMKYWS
jgi:hypothetical protein